MKIVKAQTSFTRPITMLIYDENRRGTEQRNPIKGDLKMMGADNRAFFKAEKIGGRWILREKIEEQGW